MASTSLFSMALLWPLLLLLTRTGTMAFQSRHATPTTTPRTRRFSTQTTYQVDVTAGAPRNHESFVEWADYYGVSLDNFQLNLRSDDWGAETVQPAPAGSRVLFVPAGLRITSQAARDQEFAAFAPVIDQYIDATTSDGNVNLQCHFYLFLKVLQEYERGDQSPFLSWLDALPRKFSTAVTYDDFEMDCLPPFVKVLARRDRHNYDLFLEVLQQLDTPTIGYATKVNEEVTKWAYNVVFTRARAAFGEAEIIPMSDMLNHAANPNVEVQYDDEGNVHVTLLRDVQAGEALNKCYGQPTNPSRFMATYGFFDSTPPATYCKLWPGLVVTPELKNLGFDNERMVFYVENGGVAQEVWDVVLYAQLEQIDPSAQQQFYEAHMRGDEATKGQYHQFYMAQTCSGLLQHVNEVLEELADCEKTMDGGGMGLAHQHLPVIRRHNDFVRQTFTKVKRGLEGIQSSL